MKYKDTMDETWYSSKELKILEFLAKKYDLNIQDVIDTLESQEVDISELADYIYWWDRVEKFSWTIIKPTKQRPPADIEKTIEEYCPAVLQILWKKNDEYFSPDEYYD